MKEDLPNHLLVFRHSFDRPDDVVDLFRTSVLMIGLGGVDEFQKHLIDKCFELKIHADFLDTLSVQNALESLNPPADMKPGHLPIATLKSALGVVEKAFIEAVMVTKLMPGESRRERVARMNMKGIPQSRSITSFYDGQFDGTTALNLDPADYGIGYTSNTDQRP